MIGLLTAIHVVSILLWIGGVAFVTIVVFPLILRMEGSLEKALFFQGVEHRFSRIVVTPCILVSLITGVTLLLLTGEWKILFSLSDLGPTVMILVWVLYVVILLSERRIFRAIFIQKESARIETVFRRLTVFHWFILGLSLLAVFVGVLAAHGGIL